MSNAFLRDALRASLESEVEMINPLTDEDQTNIGEVLAEVAEASDSAGADVEQADRVVDELDTASDSLEQIAATLESHIAEGGMSPQTALSHNTAMANVLRRLPIDSSKFTVSSEAFGGSGDKLVASQEALDGVKELLMKIWNAIKAAVTKAFDTVKVFIQTIRKSAPVVIAAGRALQAKANAAKGQTAKVEKMNVGATGSYLSVGGKFPDSVATALDSVIKHGESVSKSAQAGASALRIVAGKISTGSFDRDTDYNALADAVVKPLLEGELPGGKAIVINDKAAPSLGEGTKFSGEAEITVPSIEEVIKIGAAVRDIGGYMQEYSGKDFGAVEKSVNDFLASTKKGVDGVQDEAKAESMKAGLKELGKYTSLVRGVGPAYLRYAGKTAKAAVAFGNKVLAQYGAKAEAAA